MDVDSKSVFPKFKKVAICTTFALSLALSAFAQAANAYSPSGMHGGPNIHEPQEMSDSVKNSINETMDKLTLMFGILTLGAMFRYKRQKSKLHK